MEDAPFYSAPGDGQWARQANDTWFSIWDLAKPVIAQIHGYAIAGGDRARVGLRPRLRRRRRADQLPGRARDQPAGLAVPHRAARHAPRDGADADRRSDHRRRKRRAIGFANRAFPADRARGRRCSRSPGGSPACRATWRRSTSGRVHRAFDVWGARAAIRAGTELQALAGHTETRGACTGKPPGPRQGRGTQPGDDRVDPEDRRRAAGPGA